MMQRTHAWVGRVGGWLWPHHTAAWSRSRRSATLVGTVLAAYLLVAYLLLPVVWIAYLHRHPSLRTLPRVTHTVDGIPGDPLNVALSGTEAELREILAAALWTPADPLSLKSRLKIAEATVLEHPYPDAPVSDLYLDGRKEDLAFEQAVGDNPRQRHHVRFWRVSESDGTGRPLWVGSATFDERVGLSHTTGQITHHIAANIDAERDHLAETLEQTGRLQSTAVEREFHAVRAGKNGGGDPWETDGSLWQGVIRPASPSD